MPSVISFIKLLVFLLWSFAIIIPLIISSYIFAKSPKFHIIPMLYYRMVCLIYGVKIITKGTADTDNHVVFVGNHISYIDIPIIGSQLPATFIAKASVRSWPIFGLLATLSQTIFIERNREAAAKCIKDIGKTLNKNRSLILFPEGTSTQGISVLPFKSSIFDLFLKGDLKEKLLIQPFTLSVQTLDGKAPQTMKELDLYAWHGDMTMLPHLWDLGKLKEMEILLHFHAPRAAQDYDDRKQFAKNCHDDVAQGLKDFLPTTLDLIPKPS